MHSVASLFEMQNVSFLRSETEEKNGDKADGLPHPLVTLTKIDPDEIPEVPSNRYLYRSDVKKDEEKSSKRGKDNDEDERMREKRRAQIRGRTKSGRKVKGRGLLVKCLDFRCYQYDC